MLILVWTGLRHFVDVAGLRTRREPSRRDSKKHSPRKGPSPTKVKFESLAEKVGIKVTSPTPSETGEDTVEPMSPSSKRHWGVRDWIKGSKNNNS